jgi:hypothetical protein
MSHYTDLTKEQLIAELNVKDEKLKYYHNAEEVARNGMQLSPRELSDRLAIAEARLAVFEEKERREEKKREFERRMAEATEFLKANGYKVINMNEQRRQPIIPTDPTELFRQAKETIESYGFIVLSRMVGNYLPGSKQP